MNRTEEAYSLVLEARRLAGEVAEWKFEAVKLRLAENTTYTPDFLVILADGTVEFHEVKGRPGSGAGGWENAARCKIKVSAELYPFVFRGFSKLPVKSGGGWKEEVFG